jgi:hypothetical protein
VETTESNEQLPAAAVALAARLRETRSAIGGWEHLGGERFVECRDAEMLCGRRTVDTAVAIDGELHRFGEQAAAVLFANAEVAAIYRTRVEPSRPPQDVPEMSPLGLSLYRRWEMEGHCPAERLQTGSAEHAGEGTGPRAIGLSPGASVADMLMQKQLRSLAGDGEPVSDTMLEHWLERQQACQEAADMALRAGRRHWCLRWLETHRAQRVTAWVAARRGAGYLVLFDELPLSAWVPADNGLSAQVGDRLHDPRHDSL